MALIMLFIKIRGERMIQPTLQALCDPTRRQIVRLLIKGPRTAGDIYEKFDISPPAISRHLAVLREARLVEATRDGKCIVYSLCPDPLEDLELWLKEILTENQ